MIINPYILGSAYDPDAQAFITAAGITDNTQKSAINQLVVDLKTYSIWTKIDALYPFVGGNATAHSYNLKNTSQFQITFNGGWTHSSTGALPNGTNAYANTGYNLQTNASLNSHHLSYYSRTNANTATIEIGVYVGGGYDIVEINTSGTTYFVVNSLAPYATYADSDSRGFYISNRTASNVVNGWKNGTKVATGTTASTSLTNNNVYIGAANGGGSPAYYTTKECALASIGSGFTDTEAANFRTAVQAFETTLGRSIGTQTVSDANAQTFVTNANIIDQVEANAVNNLVIGLKANSLWTKMNAIYPFVGGTASTNKYNLKNPLDTDAAFRLIFNGGCTFSPNGFSTNGTNAYADTKFNMSTQITSVNNWAVGFYTNLWSAGGVDMGADTGVGNFYLTSKSTGLFGANTARVQFNDSVNYTDTTGVGFYLATRNSSTNGKAYKNGTEVANLNNASAGTFANYNVYLGSLNRNGTASFATNERYTFMFIANASFNVTEQSSLYTVLQSFQTALNR